jgi:hypothetical protein
MAEKSGGKVVVYVGANTEEFKKKIKETKSDLQLFGESAKSLKSAFSTAFAGIAAAAGALAFVKTSIQAIEGPGDDFNKMMAGSKEALYELQKAVATVDFSNLIDNLVKGFTRGKEFEGAIDDLADRTAYNDFKISELNRESKRLQEITKNKELELSVRKDAAAKLEKVEKQILDRKITLSEEAYKIEAKNWSDKNTESQIGVDEAVKLYERYNNFTEEQLNKLEVQSKAPIRTKVYDLNNADDPLGIGFTRQELYDYASYSELLANGEADVIIKLFALKSKAADAAAEAQERYNAILKQTSSLEIKADPKVSATPAILDTPVSYGKFGGQMSDQLSMQLGALTDPTLAQRVSENFKAMSAGMTPELEKMKAKIDDFKQSVTQAFENLIEGAITDFASALGAAMVSGDWEGFGAAMLSSLGKWAQQFGALLIAQGVAFNALKVPDPSGATQIAAGIALVAIGSMVSSLASNVPTAGGSSSGGYSPATSAYSSSGNSNRTMELIWRRAGKDLIAIMKDENTSVNTLTGKR